MTTTNRNALLETPDVPWASDAIELVFTQESRSVANHSARSWIFARMLRDHLNLTQEVDETLLFAATLLHDIGLRRDARDPVRFEIDGADRAAEFLTAQGLDAAQVDKVWEAIALHTSPGIPERRGPLTFLTRAGAGMDFGEFTECISDDQAAAIHEAYPRLAFARSIVDDIVEQIRATPERRTDVLYRTHPCQRTLDTAIRHAAGARDRRITLGRITMVCNDSHINYQRPGT